MYKYCLADFLSQSPASHFSHSLSQFGGHLFQALKEQLEGAWAPYRKFLTNCTDKNIFWVGGALRNLALGKPIKDWDLLIDCDNPEEVALLSRQFCDFTSASWVILDKGRGFYRAIWPQTNSVIDFCTRQGKNIFEDLQERDFTVNALAYSLKEGLLYDLGSGLGHLEEGKLALVSSHSLGSDSLRALRAVRLSLAYSLTIDSQLAGEIASFLLSGLPHIAGERLAAELAALLNLPLATHKLSLKKWAFDIFLGQNWDKQRAFPTMELSLWELLIGLEAEQKEGWPIFKHSGRLLQRVLNQSPKGGRSYLALLKLAFLADWTRLSPKSNRFKLSTAELRVIEESGLAATQLAQLLVQPPDKRQFYYFFSKVSYFFIIAAVNGVWLSLGLKKSRALGTTEANGGGAGKRAQVENSQGGMSPADKYATWALYLDCLLLDYLKGGTLSKPLVPVDGRWLQKKMGIEPGPVLGKMLRELTAECSRRSMSEEEALFWVKDRLAQDMAF